MKKKISVSMQNCAELSTTGAKHDPHLFLLHCWVFLAACTLTFLFAVNAQAQATLNQQNGLFIGLDSRDSSYRDNTDAVVRSRTVQVDVTQLGGKRNLDLQSNDAPLATAEKSSPYIRLTLFDDLEFQAKHTKTHKNTSGSITWIGTIEGQPASLAVFVVRNSNVYGLVEIPNVGIFSIRPNAEGGHTIEEIRPDAFLSGEDDFVIPKITASSAPMNDIDSESVAISNDDGSIIDVYVAYDQDASGGSVLVADAQSYAELFIAYTNQAYENSNINQRVWLVGNVDGYNYTDTDSSSLSAELSDAKNGIITGLHGKRNEYHADLVMFFAPNPDPSFCNGLSYMQETNNDVNWNANGFAAMQACSFGGSTFAHELGHTMGSQHDWYINSSTLPATIAHGYIDIIKKFKTIMSYNDRCKAFGFSCSTIPNFSNPAVSYSGAATGVASGTSSSCATRDPSPTPECDADNTTNFNTKALITSQFRDSRVTWTGAVNTNWDTAGNWTFNQGPPGSTTAVNRVPRSYDNVLIPDGLTNYPTISGTAYARELTIADGASLNMTTGTLTVGWSWEDNGGFNATDGTVVFAGPIGVTVTSSSAFQNVQIGTGSDTSIVTLEGNLDIDGNLHIQAGASLDAGSYALHLAGNWTEDDATGFTGSGTSTMIFDGSNQTVNKVTNTTLLNEDFSEGDGKGCGCNTVYLPATWTRESAWYGGSLSSDGDAIASGNGWLHSSAVSLNSKAVYTITFDFDQYQGSDTLRVYYGTAASSSGMTNLIGTINTTGSAEFSFSVPASGTYYIGFHHDGDSWSYMDNVQLTGVLGLTFYNLHVTSGTVALNAAAVINNNLQTDSRGTINFSTNSVTVEGTVTNNGAIKQTKTATNSTTTAFGTIKNAAGTNSKYYGMEITPSSGSMGETTVEIKGNQTCSGSGIPAAGVKRCYTVTPASSQTADVKFYYRSAESNSNTTPDVYLQTGGSWTAQTTSAHGGGGEAIWATGSGLTSYGTFSLSSGTSANSTGFLSAIFLLLLK